MELLQSVLNSSGKADPEAEQALQEALRKKPEPGPHAPREKTLAEVLSSARAQPPRDTIVDLAALLQENIEKAKKAPAPPVQLVPPASPFAKIGRGSTPLGFSGAGAFSGITEASAGRKKRERKVIGWQNDPEKKEPVEKLSLQLLKELGEDYQPRGNSEAAQAHFRAGVQESFELKRILEIPRRSADLSRAVDQTDLYKKPGGEMRLWPIQSIALDEAAKVGGLFAPIGVGHGKCAHGSTEVYDVSSGRRRRVDEPGAFTVATVSKDRKVIASQATAFPSGRKRCVHVKLAGGQNIILSTDHPVLTPDGWIEAAALKPDTLVGTPRFLPSPEKPLEISDAEVKFVAYMMADGECAYGNPTFTKMEPVLLQDFAGSVAALGGTSWDIHSKSCGKATTLRIPTTMRPIIDRWDLAHGARDKRLPAAFYGLSTRQVALFLNVYIACDGHVNAAGVEVSSASEKLIDDLRFLLLRLGVMSRTAFKWAKLRDQQFKSWRLFVTDHESLCRLLDLVGGSFIGREENSAKLRERLATTKANTNVDVVPIGRKEFTIICDELGFPGRGGDHSMPNPYGEWPRSTARAFLGCTAGQYVGRRKFEDFCAKYDYRGRYAWLAKSDLLWEKVIAVNDVGEHDVYDLSVPETGAFIGNGIVVHNTLVSLLVGVAMKARKIVLLVPPQLRTQLLEQDIPMLDKHWKLPLDRLRVVAYSQLSSAVSHDILDVEKPDLIVSDEAHNLRHKQAARTKRFLRYMKEHPECRFVALSGTITSRSLRDYQHLAELSLQKNSPLPRNFRDLEDWALALDVTRKDPMPPGALLQFCTDEELQAIQANMALPHQAQVHVRHAFRRRLVETQGVVATEESALGTSLVITGLHPPVPAEIQLLLKHLYKHWEIDDDELIDALAVTRVANQLSAGFHYRWVWPNGIKDVEWLEARKAWNRELRDILKMSKRGLDSPMLVVAAIKRGEFQSGTWESWAAVKDRFDPEPPREAVWHNKFLVQEAIRWGKDTCTKAEPGIIWYLHDEFGREVAKEGGFPFYGPGIKASEELARVKVKETPIIVASLRAHGTGKNLQMFSRNLFTTPPAGGKDWEQTIARTHRPGQEADEVAVDVYLHTQSHTNNFWSAIRDAKYIEQTQGQKQKLLYARKLSCSEGDD
jgi:hypothetical protein